MFCHQSGSCRSYVLGFSSWQNLMSLTLRAAGWGRCLSRGAVASLTSDHTDCWLEPACESIHPRNAPACTGFSLLLTCEKNCWMLSVLTKWVTQKLLKLQSFFSFLFLFPSYPTPLTHPQESVITATLGDYLLSYSWMRSVEN